MYRIYCLVPDVRGKEKLVYASQMKMQAKVCPVKPVHAEMQRWLRPLKVVAPVVAATDFEWTVYRDIIVNQEVAESLQQFSGANFNLVELFTTTETPIGRPAVELKVYGWGGVAPVVSGVKVLKECSKCNRQVFSAFTDPGKLFSVEGWDGSDFFIIWPLPRFVMVTERVRDHIVNCGFSGVRAIPLNELPRRVTGSLSLGHFHDWFDEKRLSEIMRMNGR